MRAVILLCSVAACHPHPDEPAVGTQLSVNNTLAANTTVYVAFGSDSKITADDWSFCEGSGLVCSFELAGHEVKPLPNPEGKYLNGTFSFGAPVGCGSTKAEVNLNNPDWFDVMDVSLVDGYSNDIEIVSTPEGGEAVVLGPPKGQDGNETVFGLFPYGCDTCVARENPPCGITKGTDGCKKGSQSDPDVPCQFQGATKGGGKATVEIVLK